ncbi:TrkH family potassium uptake protein [Desulforhopalus singaporensis]|uniref:Trk system potassium uptake protein TrkH n=1 Tax=Desulforhopalus singaporensis TaxID=91360 RepID=A0A1H0L7K8_9BACT|nr:TrkH family potassium uptake protein [Desulforhopalus singaporensis]SDO64026.1 trk system potassium uptake protein TrkH [Desulforhopalus singaporensis]
MKLKTVSNALGLVLIGYGIIILSPIVVAVLEKEYTSILPFVVASCCSITLGGLCKWKGGRINNFDSIKRSDGLLVVTLTWLVTALIGAIPYLFYGISPLDAYFESVSGLTTTGATILTDFSLYPKDFFFWRSLSQWLGGMGIIVLFIAILPQFAVAGRRLFFAEAPGPTEEKITPRIAHTAKALWMIYVLLTIAEVLLLYLAGMPLFDAVCNSLSTMAAGGFSPHPQSIMGYGNPSVVWIITFFMFLAGSNFALQYRFLVQLKPKSLLKNDEFMFYVFIVVVLSVALCGFLFFGHDMSLEKSMRDSLFQVVSILTTTGFSSADFALWLVSAQVVLMTVMFVGGCAGSAGGGIKVVRILFVGRYLKREIAQTLHPQAVLPIKIDRTTVPDNIQRQMIGFLLFYVCLLVASGLIVTIIEGDASIGFIGTAATIGNIGPGFGEIGPMGSFGGLAASTKVIFIIDMVVGRLELIPFLVMLHRDFWGVK